MTAESKSLENSVPARLKRIILFAGLALALIGFPPTLNLFCIVPFSMLNSTADTPVYVLFSLVLVAVTLVAGGVTFHHANQSLNGKPSKSIRLPSILFLMDIFGVILIIGIFVNASKILPGVFLPPLVLLAAALPPLWALSRFIEHNKEVNTLKLTWRRGVVAFAGGAAAGLFIAIALEILLPALILLLSFNLSEAVFNSLGEFLNLLSYARWSGALTRPGFIYVFLQLTLIAPLVEEFAKPLALLPILRRLSRQETFLIGAIAGAGFAVLENSLYASIGVRIWIQILFVRALGSAIQPLGSGLVALGWREVLRGEPGAWGSWARRFGFAVIMHAVWNAGSLLTLAVGEAFISGNLPREIGLPGIAVTGWLLVSLIFLGSSALWLGRKFAQGETAAFSWEPAGGGSMSPDRTMAIWAAACLITILPAGIVISRLWLQ